MTTSERAAAALNAAMEFGKKLLATQPVLYPYATVVLPSGEASMMSLSFGEVSSPEEAEAMLVRGLAEDAADGAIAAAAWGYTVDVTGEGDTFPALKVFAEARGEEPLTAYVPFKRRDGGSPEWGTAVQGPEREAVIFGSALTAKAKAKAKAPKRRAGAKAAKKATAPKKRAGAKAATKAKAPKKSAKRAGAKTARRRGRK